MKRTARLGFYAAAFLIAWAFAAYGLAAWLTVEQHLDRADAIVVLGGSADFRKRTETAAEMFKRGLAPKVFVTNDGQKGGWDAALQRNAFFYERAVRVLEEDGVPAGAIEVLPQVVDGTHEEAELLASVAQERGLTSIALVTSGFHTRRAMWTFIETARTRGISIRFGVESPREDRTVATECLWWLRPSGWRNIPVELVKLIYYRTVY